MYTSIGNFVFPSSLKIGVEIPYPVETFTVAFIFVIYLAETIRLAFLRLRNRYELYDDGLYLDTGIVNLRNVYVSPMGFSDARLFRTWILRFAKRGSIILDTNDHRHFELLLLENPEEVQATIRRTLGRPTIRIG